MSAQPIARSQESLELDCVASALRIAELVAAEYPDAESVPPVMRAALAAYRERRAKLAPLVNPLRRVSHA